MGAPPIQYTRTEDGVNIACAVSGEGAPILRTSAWPFNNGDVEWEIEALRERYAALGTLGRLIRYDPRGQGLSDTEVEDYSPTACFVIQNRWPSRPGQVLVSNVVQELCAGKTFTFEDAGAATLKGITEPVTLYAAQSA